MHLRMVKLLLLIFCFIYGNFHVANAEVNEIVVGFYEEYPYYYLDNRGNPRGYYHDIMKILAEELNLSYRYEFLSFNECIEKLERGEIDLLLGIIETKDRKSIFRYSKYRIDSLDNTVIVNKKIEFGDLETLNGLIFGYIPGKYSQCYFYDVLIDKGINFQTKVANSNSELKEWLKAGDVDFIIVNKYDNLCMEYDAVYSYFPGSRFIVTNNNNENLMDMIDLTFDEMYNKNATKLNMQYNKYFNKAFKNASYIVEILVIGSIFVILVLLFGKWKKIHTKRTVKYKYLNYLHNQQFKLYYQPIISLKRNKIMGFEALLRLDDGEKILTPDSFLNVIETLDIMYDITLWLIDKALEDYKELQLIENRHNDKIYVSINISYKDLLNENFIFDVEKILKKYEDLEYLICFEITERFKYENLEVINERVAILKLRGIQIAMDDFGIEYANFDILEKVEYDIVKLDKIFIDQCDKCIEKQQILKFILYILDIYKKKVVIEGIEMSKQIQWIKKIAGENVYLQGYYYSKPLSIENLKLLSNSKK